MRNPGTEQQIEKLILGFAALNPDYVSYTGGVPLAAKTSPAR
jgi:hypothetical protein